MKFTFIQKKEFSYQAEKDGEFLVLDGHPGDFFFVDYAPEVERLKEKKFAGVPMFTFEDLSPKEVEKAKEVQELQAKNTPTVQYEELFGKKVPKNVETDEEILALIKEKQEVQEEVKKEPKKTKKKK